jgi:hypothetical protein
VLWAAQLAFRFGNKMTIDRACEIMEHYAVQQDLEDLDAIEHMVENYSTLDPNVKQALKVFMATAKEMA